MNSTTSTLSADSTLATAAPAWKHPLQRVLKWTHHSMALVGVGAIAGACLGGAIGCVLGFELGNEVGNTVDTHWLDSHSCITCGHTFSPRLPA